MAKIADLLVQLTVETASFRRDLNTAQKTVKDFGDGLAGTFGKLQGLVTGGIQAFGIAMAVDFVKSTNEGIDALGKLSQKIGVSVEDLSSLQHAAALANVPIETFATGIGLLSKAMAGFTNDENKGASAALQNIGINARDANGQLRPTKDVLADIANAFAGMEDGAQKTSLALQLFGRSGKELIPLLNGGANGLREMQDEAGKLGLQLDEKTAKAAERFNDNLTRLQGASKGLAQTLVTELLPSLNRISDGLVEAAKSGDRFNSIQAIGKALDFVLATLSSIVAFLRVAIDYVGKFFGAIGAAAQLVAKGDFAGLRALDERLRKEFLDPFRDFSTEVSGIWGTAMNGIQDSTDTTVSLVDKRINAVLFGIRSAKTQLSDSLAGGKEAAAIKAARDEYAQTIAQLSSLWVDAGNRRIEIENAVLDAIRIRDQKIADATKASTDKRIADAKRYAEELQRANATLDDMAAKFKGDIDPFDKIQQDYGQAIDKLTAIWNKYPETRARIEDLILAAVKDRDQKIIAEEQKTLEETGKLIADHLKSVGPQLQNIPNPTKTISVALDTSELSAFYARAVQQLSKFGTDADKELEKIFKVDRIKQSIDELILRIGTAGDGIRLFFRQYADYATNSAKVFHDAFAKVFSALEDQLTNLLAHFKFDFKSLLDTIKESIARAVVQKFILGPIAQALGLAKNDGSTEAQALWVRIAKNTAPSKDESSGGLFGGLLGSIFGGSGIGGGTPDGSSLNPFHVIVDNQGSGGGDGGPGSGGLANIQQSFGKIFSSIGSFFGKIGSAILSAFKFIGSAIGGLFGGAFADGGDMLPNTWNIVGERGPEIIRTGSVGGTVIPNHVAFGGKSSTANITNNFYLSPVRSDPFGYSSSQIANAVFTGQMRSLSRA